MHPLTTKEVQRRRLVGCDVPEPSLWDLFPVYRNDELLDKDIASFQRELTAFCALGVEFCIHNRLPSLPKKGDIYPSVQELLEDLKTDPEFV